MPLGAEIVVDAGCAPLRDVITSAFARDVPRGRGLHVIPHWLDLARADEDDSPDVISTPVALVGLRQSDGLPSEDLVQRLRGHSPALAIHVCAAGPHGLGERLVRFARAGADDVFVLDSAANSRALRAAVIARLLAPAPERVLRRFAAHFGPSEVTSMALHMLRNGFAARTVEQMARCFGLHRATLHERLRAEGFPSAGCLLRLSCDLHARELEPVRGLTRDVIARRVGRSGAPALRAVRWRLRKAELHDEALHVLRRTLEA